MTSTLSLYDLPATVQDEALFLKKHFERISQSGQPVRRELLKLANNGRSISGLYRLLKRWMDEGDMALVDKRQFSELWAKKGRSKLPAEFLNWAAGQMLANQRKSKPAYRSILTRWKEWRRTGDPALAIPGYDLPPLPSSKGYPEGWSYRTLMRVAQPSKAQLTIARQGTAAAKKHLPCVTGTREGSRWLEWVFFDDVWHDRKCIVPGYNLPVRILQLGCLDHASAVYLKFGIRPDLPRDDGTRDRLKRRDMLMLVASLLMEYGYPLDYPMHLVVERGTATMTLAESQLLYDLSGGQIQVGYTSMDGMFVLAWQEASSGNSQGKGPLESWHNLFHNELASLPGQVGKDRDHQPAALYGSDREAVALNKASLLMTPEQRSGISSPYPTLEEAHQQTLAVVARINRRTDHQLEGFSSKALWRIKGTSTDFLPSSELAGIDPSLSDHLEWLAIPESPWERASGLSAQVRVGFIPQGALVRFYEDSHFKTTIKGRQASISHKGKLFTFGLPEAEQMTLPEGAVVYLHFDPLNAAYALVTGENSVFVGCWTRQRVPRGNSNALSDALRRKQAYLNQAVGAVRGKMGEQLAREERRMDANLSALASADLIPDSAFQDLAHGRQIISTPIAEGMQQAVTAHQEAANHDKARARMLRSVDASGLLDDSDSDGEGDGDSYAMAAESNTFSAEDLL